MSDEIKNAENEAPKAEQSTELSETALDQVTGGTKTVDVASPTLYGTVCTGKHYPEVKI